MRGCAGMRPRPRSGWGEGAPAPDRWGQGLLHLINRDPERMLEHPGYRSWLEQFSHGILELVTEEEAGAQTSHIVNDEEG